MKTNKKNKVFRFFFWIFFVSFLVVYFSEATGYYEYQNYKKSELTEEQIRKYEEDVKNGVEIDLNQYLIVKNTNYNNKLSKFTSMLSEKISDTVKTGVEKTFKYISKLVDE